MFYLVDRIPDTFHTLSARILPEVRVSRDGDLDEEVKSERNEAGERSDAPARHPWHLHVQIGLLMFVLLQQTSKSLLFQDKKTVHSTSSILDESDTARRSDLEAYPLCFPAERLLALLAPPVLQTDEEN